MDFTSKAFWPVTMKSGEEEIEFTKRPMTNNSEIVDIRNSDTHLGMFVGIQKLDGRLLMGASGINKSHEFRNIITNCFLKILEYVGLQDVNEIVVTFSDSTEVNLTLAELGFQLVDDKYYLELDPNSLEELSKKVDEMDLKPLDQVQQILKIIKLASPEASINDVRGRFRIILRKIKNMNPFTQNYWDSINISKINQYLTGVELHPEQVLHVDEFIEMMIKTIVNYFPISLRRAYSAELVEALLGHTIFHIDFIQQLVERIIRVVPGASEETDKLKEEIVEWINRNEATWQKAAESKKENISKQQVESTLNPEDFGEEITGNVKLIVDGIVKHYNGESMFYGIEKKV